MTITREFNHPTRALDTNVPTISVTWRAANSVTGCSLPCTHECADTSQHACSDAIHATRRGRRDADLVCDVEQAPPGCVRAAICVVRDRTVVMGGVRAVSDADRGSRHHRAPSPHPPHSGAEERLRGTPSLSLLREHLAILVSGGEGARSRRDGGGQSKQSSVRESGCHGR